MVSEDGSLSCSSSRLLGIRVWNDAGAIGCGERAGLLRVDLARIGLPQLLIDVGNDEEIPRLGSMVA
jgi:hypothetical protein